jgi:hypothetical protein
VQDKFGKFLLTTIAVAWAAAIAPVFTKAAMLTVSLPLTALWIVLFTGGVFVYGKPGLKVLLGAPLAFIWPVGLAFVHAVCAEGTCS